MPFNKRKKNSDGLVKGIVLAHVVLVLHLFLFALLGLLVTFLTGVMHYMTWILLGGMVVVALSAYLFYRRLRQQGKSIGEALRSPEFAGRSMEISLLGGMATVRLGKPDATKALPAASGPQPLQLEDPDISNTAQIEALAQLMDEELITPEEFAKAKERLLGSG